MSLIKKYGVVIAVVLSVLILVLIRSTGSNHFETDTKKWAGPSFTRENIITQEQMSKLQGKSLTINLDKGSGAEEIRGDVRNISSDSLLSKDNISMIQKHDGPILLTSSDPSLSARIWMLLSQMGCRKLYIIADNPENEVLKYKLQQDSLVKSNLP